MARVVAQVPGSASTQIALEAVIVIVLYGAPPAPLTTVAVVNLIGKLVGVWPSTKLFAMADVQVTEPALVATRVDINVKARNIILFILTCARQEKEQEIVTNLTKTIDP